MTEEEIIPAILEELRKAELKHKHWPADLIHADAIINEEKGELTRALVINHYERDHRAEIKKEAIQTGAMIFRFLKNLPPHISEL